MSDPRKVIDFSKPQSNATLTQALGVTLTCLHNNKSYEAFKDCLFNPAFSAEGEGEDHGVMAGVTGAATAIAQGVANTASNVANALSGKKNKFLLKK